MVFKKASRFCHKTRKNTLVFKKHATLAFLHKTRKHTLVFKKRATLAFFWGGPNRLESPPERPYVKTRTKRLVFYKLRKNTGCCINYVKTRGGGPHAVGNHVNLRTPQ